MLTPFGKPRKAAGYTGASGPSSPGRMPKKNASKGGSKPTPNAETLGVDEVDGSVQGHDYGDDRVGAYSRSLPMED
jgi:hypothetical protein